MTPTHLDAPREWVSFADPARTDHLVRADLTWLLSTWGCIFGRGCHGIVEGRAEDGCCSHGAFFSGTEDRKRVVAMSKELTAEDWQRVGTKKVVEWDDLDGERTRRTRAIDGACVFLNRPDFAGGAGCSLHRMALRTGRHPLETKPDVCWQLPIHCSHSEEEGVSITTITEFDRSGWGEGGTDLHWWCTESAEAHGQGEPLYVTYGPELAAMLGDPAYAELARLCTLRRSGGVLPHPAVG